MIDDEDIQNYLETIKKSKIESGAYPISKVGATDTQKADGQKTIKSGKSVSPTRVFIDPSCDVRGIERMKFGNNVMIQKDCWLNIAFNNPAPGPMITIDEGTNIGRRCTLSAANRISIGKHVLMAPNVLISDHNHEYRNLNIPIMHQGITTHEAQVIIGDETWLGINSVIIGNVKIGKHCVIGANSVINTDIPDYSVAVGNPAKVVKTINAITENKRPSDQCAATIPRTDFDADLRKYVLPIHSLGSLQVEVSSACNLSCPQCFRYIEGHKAGFFPRNLWDSKIKPLLPQLKDIHLVGIGEPLLSKDFFAYVEDAKKNNIKIHTTSNLQLLNENMAEKIITSGLDVLSFSCDGATKETYEHIRIKGTFEKLHESLSLINRFKIKHKTQSPCLILNFGATEKNIRELPDVVKLAGDHRVNMIIAYHNVAYIPELREESLYHHQALSDEYFVQAKLLAQKLGINMFIPGLFSNPLKYSPKGAYCGYPFSHLYIYHDGRVGPCCMDFPDRYILGDLNRAGIEEIWNDDPILRLRKELNTCPSDTCKYCVSHGKMDIRDPGYFFRFKSSESYIKNLPGKNIRQRA